MKAIYALTVAGIFAFASVGSAQTTGKTFDHNGLREILVAAGYQPEKFEVPGGQVAYKINVAHRDGSRTHMVAIDARTQAIMIVGGGFSSIPDPNRASNAWYRKLMKINNSIAPSQIFLNDTNVFGLTTVFGNVNVTPESFKQQLQRHVQIFDNQLAPLVGELVGATPSTPIGLR